MLALGVDLAADAIGLALVERTGRSTRLVGAWRDPRDPAMPAAAALRAAIAAHCPSPPEAIASALPGSAVGLRVLRLPFVDAARLAATVPFELESLVPFDLDQAVTTHTVLAREGGTSTVLAAIAPREAVRRHLDELAAAGLDPALVDLGSLATVALLLGRTRGALVVEPRDDGAVALLREGRVVGLRVLDAGAPADREALLAQARWSALALGDDAPLPALLAVAEPGALAAELAAGLGVSTLPLAAHLPPWAEGIAPGELRAAALAARAAGVLEGGLDFRSGDLAYHAPSEEARRQLRSTGWLLAATAVLAASSFLVALRERHAEQATLQQEIARSVASVLPGAAPGGERAQLQAAVEALERRRDRLSGTASRMPPALEVLRQIAAALPEQLALEIDELSLDADGLRLHGRTASYESVDVVKRSLQSIAGARDPQVKDVKTGIDGRVEFRATLSFPHEATP